jgi:hypothetical protein
MDDSAIKKSPCASPTGGQREPPSISSAQPPQFWNFTGDKQKDDLRMFTTGDFYDCTFKVVSNDMTNESKVNIFLLEIFLNQKYFFYLNEFAIFVYT